MKHTTQTFINTAARLFMIALLAFQPGCGGGTTTTPRKPNSQLAAPPTTTVSAPVLIAMLEDKSGSMKSARTSSLQESDLRELLEVLCQTGGELAFGLIGEASSLPLLRVRVPSPPVPPVKPSDENPFVRAEKSTEFSQAQELYEADYQRWDTDVGARVNDFLAAARQRLAAPLKDRTSPVYEAVARAQLFLSERGWPKNSRRLIVLQSDCQDTTSHKPVELKGGTAVLIVNGSGSLGVFANVEPRPFQFESIASALEFIKTEARR